MKPVIAAVLISVSMAMANASPLPIDRSHAASLTPKYSAGLLTVVGKKVANSKAKKKPPQETGGPIVDSGPTKGQNRSRNQDGTWRKKRSDAKDS